MSAGKLTEDFLFLQKFCPDRMTSGMNFYRTGHTIFIYKNVRYVMESEKKEEKIKEETTEAVSYTHLTLPTNAFV